MSVQGPFYRYAMRIRRGNPSGLVATASGDQEARELVDLLNKGTHFDAMLAALKEAKKYLRFMRDDEGKAHKRANEVIAAVEGDAPQT